MSFIRSLVYLLIALLFIFTGAILFNAREILIALLLFVVAVALIIYVCVYICKTINKKD